MTRVTLALFVASLFAGCGSPNDMFVPDGGIDAPTPDLLPPDGGPGVPADLSGIAMLAIDDSSFQFDPVAGAPKSPAHAFKVTNLGGQATSELVVDVHGNDADRFRIDSDDCSGKVLPSGASCHVSITLGAPEP